MEGIWKARFELMKLHCPMWHFYKPATFSKQQAITTHLWVSRAIKNKFVPSLYIQYPSLLRALTIHSLVKITVLQQARTLTISALTACFLNRCVRYWSECAVTSLSSWLQSLFPSWLVPFHLLWPLSGSSQRFYLWLLPNTGVWNEKQPAIGKSSVILQGSSEVLKVEVQCMNLPVNMAMLTIFKIKWTNVFGWSWSSWAYWTLFSLWTCLRGMRPKWGNSDATYASKPRRTSPSTIW